MFLNFKEEVGFAPNMSRKRIVILAGEKSNFSTPPQVQ